jgi:hypothetical protein
MKKTAFAVALLLMLIDSMIAGAKPTSATNLPEDSWASKAIPKGTLVIWEC